MMPIPFYSNHFLVYALAVEVIALLGGKAEAAASSLTSLEAPGKTCPLYQSSGIVGSDYEMYYRQPILKSENDQGDFMSASVLADVYIEGQEYVNYDDRLTFQISPGGPNGGSDGWTVTNVTHPFLAKGNWNHSEFGVQDSRDLFWCEIVDVTFDPGQVFRMMNVRLSAFTDDIPGLGGIDYDQSDICDLSVFSPCPDDKVCHMVDGKINCVVPEDGIMSPVAGMTRPEFLKKYWCATPPPSTFGDEKKAEDFLYWSTPRGHSFLQASAVNLTLADGTQYRFQDDWGRPAVINDGGEGETLERIDDWMEDGVQRRLMFNFFPNVDMEKPHELSFPRKPFADELGWHLELAWAYGNDLEWVYSVRLNESTPLRVPSSAHLFYCEQVDLELYLEDPLPYVSSLSKGGRFSAQHVYMGAFMDQKVPVCKMPIFNPCQDREGREFCQIKNGVLSCMAPPPAKNSTIIAKSRQFNVDKGVVRESLLCKEPSEEFPTELPSSDIFIHWETDNSLLHASNATLQYRDGTVLSFDDDLGREPCFYSADKSSIRREAYWTEGGVDRMLDISTSLNYVKVSPNYYQDYPNYALEWNRGAQTSPLGYLAVNTLFVCEYVEFDLFAQEGWRSLQVLQEAADEYLNHNQNANNGDDDEGSPNYDDGYSANLYSIIERPIQAKFRAHNFAIAPSLGQSWKEERDYCKLARYNPCEGKGSCKMINGDISCVSSELQAQSRSMPSRGPSPVDLGCGGVLNTEAQREEHESEESAEESSSACNTSAQICMQWLFVSLLFFI